MNIRLRRIRDWTWAGCGAGIVASQVLVDQINPWLIMLGVSLTGLAALHPEDPPTPPAAADENPLDRHTRIAGMLDDTTRQWLRRQAEDLPEGSVIHGMAVPDGYHVTLDHSGQLILRKGYGLAGVVTGGKIRDAEVRADKLGPGQFELTNDEYNRYVRTVQRAQEIKAMLNVTSEAFEQTPDGDPVAPRLQSQAAGLRQALRDAQDDIRAQSDSWKVT